MRMASSPLARPWGHTQSLVQAHHRRALTKE